MPANYNNSAWFYDKLSQMVYGHAIIKAQVFLLQYIPANANILIVGGGTGWILEEITDVHASGLKITYAEVAPNMMALSKKRNIGNNPVVFINDAIENIPLPADFDAVITPFLFDNFTEHTLNKVFGHIHATLKPDGLWLNADFRLTGKWWQPVLLKTMFLFFKLLCNIETSQLPDIEKQFKQHGYRAIAQKTFFGDFIVSNVFKK
jgi:ubiquinone/menaquinone biosynthesis C-methylase UbiE